MLVLALGILGLSTRVWSQQSGQLPLACMDEELCPEGGSSITIDMNAPYDLPDSMAFNLEVKSAVEITLIGPEEITLFSEEYLGENYGGRIQWEINFDDLGLPAGLYTIEEKFIGTVIEPLGMIPTPEGEPFSLVLSAEFAGWDTPLSPGARIIIDATASGRGGLSGTFSGETEFYPEIPDYIWGLQVTAEGPVAKGDPLSVTMSFEGINAGEPAFVTKETTIIRPVRPPQFIEPTTADTYNYNDARNDGNPVNEGALVTFDVATDNPEATIDYFGGANDPFSFGATFIDGVFSWNIPLDAVTVVGGTMDFTANFKATLISDAGDVLTSDLTATITVKDVLSDPVIEEIVIDGAPVVETQPVTVAELQTVTAEVVVTDPDDDPETLFYSANIGGFMSPAWKYTPPLDTVVKPDYEPVEKKVTITVTDLAGHKAEKSFLLEITDFNPAPEMTPVGPLSVSEGDTLPIRLEATDPEDNLVFAYSVEPTFPEGVTVDDSDFAANGILSITPDNTTIRHPELSKDFVVTATATDDHYGADDARNATSEIKFTITINDTNLNPKLTGFEFPSGKISEIGNLSVDMGKTLAFTVKAIDPDLEDTTLTYEARFMPRYATFDETTGMFSWMPIVDKEIDQSNKVFRGITFFARDEYGGVAYETIDITVGAANHPPEITSITRDDGTTGTKFPVSEGETIKLTVNATDADPDDDLKYSAVGLPSGDEENNDGTSSAPNVNFSENTHIFTWTPGYDRSIDSAAAGVYAITFVVREDKPEDEDPLSDSVVVIIMVSPTNRPPVIDPPIDDVITYYEGDRVEIHVSAKDLDKDELTLQVDGKPVDAYIERTASWNLIWQTDTSVVSPPDTERKYPMTFIVSDGIGEPAKDEATLIIKDVNLPPKILTIGGIEPDVEFNVPKGGELNFNVVAFDPEGGTLTFDASGVPTDLDASFDKTNGVFTWPIIPDDAAETYKITITVTDPANNTSTPALAIINTIVVEDTKAPAPPTITEILPAQITNSTDITVNGTSEPRSIVSVFFDGTEVGSAKATSDEPGKFSISISSVEEGEYSVTATATDAAKNPPKDSLSPWTLIVDLTPPEVTIKSPQTEMVANSKPQLSAEYDAGISGLKSAKMQLFDKDNNVIAEKVKTELSITGVISTTVTQDLIRRMPYELKVTVTDNVGYSKTVTHSFKYNPYAADIIPPEVTEMTISGIVEGTDVTNEKRPKISATFTDAGGINPESISFELTGGTPALEEVQYNSETSEAFTYPVDDLDDGVEYTATVHVKDQNDNPASKSVTFEVDTTPPEPPKISKKVGGLSEFTNTNSITVFLLAEEGSTVNVTESGKNRGTAIAEASLFAMNVNLTEGKNNLVFTATDPYGNVSQPSTAETTLDKENPTISITPGNGDIINNSTPTIVVLFTDVVSGINPDEVTVSMTLPGYEEGDGSFDPDTNRFSYTAKMAEEALENGQLYTVTAKCKDNAGNSSELSTSTFTYKADADDETPPTFAGFFPADGALFNGLNIPTSISVNISDAESGVNDKSIRLYVDGFDVPDAGNFFDSGTGQLSYPVDFTTEEVFPVEHHVQVSAEDNKKNGGKTSISFTIDAGINPPELESLTPALSGAMDDAEVTISGKAEKNSTVEIFRNGVSIGTAEAHSTFTMLDVPLQEGKNTFTAIATDAAGNISSVSNSVTVTRDTVSPSITNFAPVGYTKNQTPEISMSILDIGGSGVKTIEMQLDFGLSNLVFDSNPLAPINDGYNETTGRLTYTPSSPLVEGLHTVIMKVYDEADNLGDVQFSFPVDVTGPTIGLVPSNDADVSTAYERTFPYMISGTVMDIDEYGNFSTHPLDISSIEMFLDNKSVGTYDIGEKQITIEYEVRRDDDKADNYIADGVHLLRVLATDKAGNSTVETAAFTVGPVPDEAPPAIMFSYPEDGDEISSTSFYIVEFVLVDDGSGPHWETLTILINGTDETGEIAKGNRIKLDRATGTVRIYPRKYGPLDLSQLERPTGFARGQNSIRIRMADNAGNIMDKTLTFNIPDPPNMPFIAKIPASTNQETIAVKGNVPNASSSVQVTVLTNNLVAGAVSVDDDGNFTLEQAFLDPGTNSIAAYSSDNAGNRSVTSMPLEILLDQTPPDVKLLDVMLSELPEATKTSTLTVRAQFVDDSSLPPASFKLVLNGKEQELLNQADVTQTLTLTEGANTIVLHATDAAGNEAVPFSHEIELDTTGPETAPENLRAGVSISGEEIVLTWEADEDAATYNVYKNIQAITNILFLAPVAVNVSDTSWTDSDVIPSMTYYYAVTSVDAAGNEGTQISNSPNVTLVPASAGGMIAMADGTRLSFAKAALSDDPILIAAVTVETLTDDDVPSLDGAIEGSVRSVTATSQSGEAITASFKQPAQLSIPYPATTESPEDMKLFVLTDDAWRPIGNVNAIPGLNLAMVDIENFGIYRLAIPSLNPDVNGDGVVDILDVALVAEHFGGTGPEGDANVDGIVDISDLAFVAVHYGEEVSTE